MKNKKHQADLCVVGGGVAGMCAAIAAARHGAKVVLMQDRPVLGGNASSEIRMWICGAHGNDNRETGIVEELLLENMYRNPSANYSLWDSVLYEKARFQENLTLLLNTTCTEAAMDGSRIRSIKGWQLTSETWHEVEATNFADCSGDSILAPLTGAEFRMGREARSEFNESIEPEQADLRTMGMSCLIQARETDAPCEFIPPTWAHRYTSCDSLPNRAHRLEGCQNFWWLEIGGEGDTLHDAEENRDELLKIAFGVWDHIKNHCSDRELHRNWDLEWVGFLPGKRESRRYIGDHTMTQNDVSAGGNFADIIAYGGWSMDDHHPAGFRYPGKPTIFHPAPSPFGIPYRCLYSRNIVNLFCAGRNISATHAAMSSSRVMATCALLGQAVGTAAAIAAANGLTPREVGQQRIGELQQTLMADDCRLPGLTRTIAPVTAGAILSATGGKPEGLRSGYDRPVEGKQSDWSCRPGDSAEYRFNAPVKLKSARLVFDSDLNRPVKNILALLPKNREKFLPPPTLVKDFRLEYCDQAGQWREAAAVKGNYQRLTRISLDCTATAIRLVIDATWGADVTRVFAWEVE